MRWITDEGIFKDALSTVDYCRRVEHHQAASSLRRMIFDSLGLCTRPFLGLLRGLMNLSGDDSCLYLVVEPDPEEYFWANFKKYPLVEIGKDDVASDYFSSLNEDPGGSPADAIGTNWAQFFIFPTSKKWFVIGRRDNETDVGGHLYVPADWINQVIEAYPHARI